MRIRLQEWLNANIPDDEMIFKKAALNQVMFVRDRIAGLFGCGLIHHEVWRMAHVISTHRSKSIDLPVYELTRPDRDLRLILRDNFYNWKMSVISDTPVIADFSGLCHTTPPIDPKYTGDELASVYFEGFPRELVFGYYEPSDKKRFSMELSSDYKLYMAVFLMMRALGEIKPYKWSTRDTFPAMLDAKRKRVEEWEAAHKEELEEERRKEQEYYEQQRTKASENKPAG